MFLCLVSVLVNYNKLSENSSLDAKIWKFSHFWKVFIYSWNMEKF